MTAATRIAATPSDLGPATAASSRQRTKQAPATLNAVARVMRPEGIGRSGRSCASIGASQASFSAMPPAYANADARRRVELWAVNAPPLTDMPMTTSAGAVKMFGRRTSSNRVLRRFNGPAGRVWTVGSARHASSGARDARGWWRR